jgi:hypothetical protein
MLILNIIASIQSAWSSMVDIIQDTMVTTMILLTNTKASQR